MKMPLVSIVILCWNRQDDVRESLLRIRGQKYANLEVIVVDNASTDGTPKMIETDFPEVKLLRMYKNLGIEAYNIGFENAGGEYIVILDDDSFPEENALIKMVEKFTADEKLGVVAFDVRNYYNYDDIKNNGESGDSAKDKATSAVPADYLLSFNGAGAGVRKKLFKQVGYYPAEFFLYWNETDCALRILNSGYKIQFFTDVISYHKYSPRNRESWRAPYYYTRNAFWLLWKNYPAGIALEKTLKLIYGCLYYSLDQRTGVYLRGLFDAFIDIKSIREKRKAVDRHIIKKIRIPFHTIFTYYR